MVARDVKRVRVNSRSGGRIVRYPSPCNLNQSLARIKHLPNDLWWKNKQERTMIKRTLIMAIGVIAFYGCNSTKISEDASPLNVSFEWTKKSACSTTSPLILVTNIPKETKFLKVEMVDLDMPTYDHGGGEVSYDGSNTIKEGALKTYAGPCPPPGVEHSYEITVKALSADKKLILGHGKAIRKFKKARSIP